MIKHRRIKHIFNPLKAHACYAGVSAGNQSPHISSRWVLVEAFSDYPQGVDMLKHVNSSLVEGQMTSDNKTLQMVEGNRKGSCCGNKVLNSSSYASITWVQFFAFFHRFLSLNLLLPGTKELDGILSAYDDQGRADIYQSCPDCLLCIYSGSEFLLCSLTGKEGKHQDADDLKAAAIVHKKMAECLKFDVSTWFTYNGTAEMLCDREEICS
uniref:Uncharacterized protein n=1 Tax=Stegastes partitus TaxID=144197 RepID=A0A3B4ZTY4_9TELE